MNRDIDESSENVIAEWSKRASEGSVAATDDVPAALELEEVSAEAVDGTDEDEHADGISDAVAEPEALEIDVEDAPAEDAVPEAEEADDAAPISVAPSQEHAVGELDIPDGYAVLEGVADGSRRAVGLVVARFNGAVTSRLLGPRARGARGSRRAP